MNLSDKAEVKELSDLHNDVMCDKTMWSCKKKQKKHYE